MTWKYYEGAKETLVKVAEYNGLQEDVIQTKIKDVLFIKQYREEIDGS